MFTGIIEQSGKIVSNDHQDKANTLVVTASFEGLDLGESIAVNGVCLTLTSTNQQRLVFDVSPETLSRTTLGSLAPDHQVNLERAMHASARFGGHYVSGHVDCTVRIKAHKMINGYCELTLGHFEPQHMKYLLPKGSITVDGVSLTINSVVGNSIQLMLVPHTLSLTNLNDLFLGKEVNIEFDYLTRIVAHQLQTSGQLMSEVEP